MTRNAARWKADYDHSGYLVVPNAIHSQTLARLDAAIEEIRRDPDSLPPHLKQHIDFERNYVKARPDQNDLTPAQVGNAIRNIMELPLFSPGLAEFIAYPAVLDVLEALFGTSEFSFHNYKCIVKAPRVSSKFVWHRDLPYLQHTGPNLITAMVCLDAMTEANGATVVMPGTHNVPHETVTKDDTDIPEDKLPAGERVTVCCPAGSLVLFHVNLIHGGGANRSDNPRRNVISIWAGPDTYPTYPHRFAYQGLMPRSRDIYRQRQVQRTFPNLKWAPEVVVR